MSFDNDILGVIPTRYNSSRLPGKALADIGGKPMIQHVWERSYEVLKDNLVVATDCEKIRDVVKGFGGKVVMTSSEHESGTSRLCEVAEKIKYDYYINIQGDQPFLDNRNIKKLSEEVIASPPDFGYVFTLVTHMKAEDILDDSVAKVILSKENRVLYFSRAAIPHPKSGSYVVNKYKKHVGLYGFTRGALNVIRTYEVSDLEYIEGLEQLTWLYEGMPVIGIEVDDASKFSVDTPKDLEKAREFFKTQVSKDE